MRLWTRRAENADAYTSMHRYLLGPGLLATNGPTHRRQRKLLTPVFSHAQMKRLAPLMRTISRQLRDLFIEDVVRGTHDKTSKYEVDMANWFGRVGLSVPTFLQTPLSLMADLLVAK